MTSMVKRQMSDTMIIGILLTIVGGFVDAYTFIGRGGVFANAQSGNLILLGMNIAEGNYFGIFRYIAPIAAFILGIIISDKTKNELSETTVFHWRQLILLFEILILGVVMLMPGSEYDVLADTAISFICSLQVQSFRKLEGNSYATTMCTGNLRSGTELLYKFYNKRNKSDLSNGLKYYYIIFAFVIGAVMGGVSTEKFYNVALVIPIIVLFISVFLMFKKEV